MKKIFLTAILLTAFLPHHTCMAQDTLSGALVHENYFYRSGIYFDSNDFPKQIEHWSCGGPIELYNRCITDDTLTVYGIATILGNPKEWGDWWMYAFDTTEAGCIDFLLLAIPDADSAIRVREIEVNPYFTPTAYFVNFAGGPLGPPHGDWRDRLYLERVVEQEFEPFQVHDTFFVGRTFLGGYTINDLNAYDSGPLGGIRLPKDTYDTLLLHFAGGHHPWLLNNINDSYTYLYPMLIPPDTTTSDTTAAITPAQFVDRMVGISPNPTSGLVRVVSNFGIYGIEVYDPSGTLIATPMPKQKSTHPLTKTFNTDSWPTGTYILRIYTPGGPAVKKLTVAR